MAKKVEDLFDISSDGDINWALNCGRFLTDDIRITPELLRKAGIQDRKELIEVIAESHIESLKNN